MANIRNLKKKITFLADDLVTVLCIKNAENGANEEKVSQLIVESISLKNKFLNKINNPSDTVKAKTYFRSVKDELMKDADELVKKINEL